MKLWIDTDVGGNPDDAVALVLARVHRDVELVGVSTVGPDPLASAASARELLADEVPVVDGSHRLVETLAAAEPDALLAIGPLTNVAHLAETGVALPSRIVVMGGALGGVEHRGAVREVETNFGADPVAARFVLTSVSCTIVPLDVTARMKIDEDQRRRLATAYPALARNLCAWPHELCLHDPLALFVLLDEIPVVVEHRNLDVDGEGRLIQGSASCSVVVSTDVEAAVARVMTMLAGGGPLADRC